MDVSIKLIDTDCVYFFFSIIYLLVIVFLKKFIITS